MKKGTLGKSIFTIAFFVALGVYSYLSASQTFPAISENSSNYIFDSSEGLAEIITDIDTKITENAYARYILIEAYGYVNKFLGKTEINGFDYALDEFGGYNPVNFSDEVDNIDYKEVAQRVVAFKEEAESHGANFIYLQSPDKIDENWNSGIDGIPYENKNKKTDKLLAWFERYGIDVIDFRETLASSGLTYQEMFYNTDHHWTGVAAFTAFKELVTHLNECYDQSLDEDGYYTNIDNYSISYCEDTYLGSAGRDIGYSFGECNDHMQLVVPKFSGDISWMGYRGDYADTVFRYGNLKPENEYESDVYGFYLYGVEKEDHIVNNDNPDGLKILFVRDSFMSPVIIDMIPFCSQIDCYWGLYVDEEELKEKVSSGNYDYIILSYGTLNIEEENFNFYVQDCSE